MGINLGWAAALFFIGLIIGSVFSLLRHRHDLDPFRK